MGKHSTERRSHAIPKASIGKRHKARASQGSIPNPSSNQPSRKGITMSKLAYFTNLLYTVAFIYSIVEVSENPAPLWIFTLVVSTIAMAIIFLTHCYQVNERE